MSRQRNRPQRSVLLVPDRKVFQKPLDILRILVVASARRSKPNRKAFAVSKMGEVGVKYLVREQAITLCFITTEEHNINRI